MNLKETFVDWVVCPVVLMGLVVGYVIYYITGKFTEG